MDDEIPTRVKGNHFDFKIFDEWREENIEKIRLTGRLHVTNVEPRLRKHLKADIVRLYNQCGSLDQVCEVLMLSPGTLAVWRSEDKEFHKALDDAKSEGVLQLLEEQALRVAQGKETMSASQISMLQFLLKSYGKERFSPDSEPGKKQVTSFKLVEAKKLEPKK